MNSRGFQNLIYKHIHLVKPNSRREEALPKALLIAHCTTHNVVNQYFHLTLFALVYKLVY